MLRLPCLLLCCLLPVLLPAQEPAPQGLSVPPEVSRALTELQEKGVATERLIAVLPQLGVTGVRARLAEILAARTEFPRLAFVALLTHDELAVRMGALEFLEEASGGDFGFSPWIAPGAEENRGPVSLWRAWAGETGPVRSGRALSDDQRQSCLREILAGDPDKSARARNLLEADGLGSLEFLESYLAATPALPAAARVRIRGAEYQIVLARRFGPQAAALARDLTTGSRDQLLSALVTIRSAGLASLPILRDFVSHEDPLVRETAVDSCLITGGPGALKTIAPLLETETDVNVIHGALRRLKDMPGKPALDLAGRFLTHPDEDLLVSALQTCQQLCGGNKRSYDGSPSAAVPADLGKTVTQLLGDARWRVRTAALEFVTAVKLASAKAEVARLLGDPDAFVRFAAIKAAGALNDQSTLPELRSLFLKDDAMIGPVIEGYGTLSASLDEPMSARLREAPPEVKVSALRSMEANASHFLDLFVEFASDPDPDVACTALRFLASDAERLAQDEVEPLLLAAMRGTDQARLSAVFEGLELPRNERIQPLALKPKASEAGPPTSLDPLYDAFLKPLATLAAEGGGGPPMTNLVVAETLRLAQDPDFPLAWKAAEALSDRGWPQAWGPLIRLLPTLSTAQKVEAARPAYPPSGPDCVTFFTALLADPVQEVREAAAATMINAGEKTPDLVPLMLPVLTSEAGVSPAGLLGYSFRDSVQRAPVARVLRPWALARLRDPAVPAPVRVFAALILEVTPDTRTSAPAVPARDLLLATARTGETVWLRQAAWHALAAQDGGFVSEVGELIRSPDVPVRLVLPDICSGARSRWVYQFDDLQRAAKPWYDSTSSRRPPQPLIDALETLASRDPSPVVRFEAQFALLTQRETIDLDAFVALISQQPAESRARYRLTDWLEDSVSTAGPGLRPLLAVLDRDAISQENFSKLLTRVGAENVTFETFGDLASVADTAGQPQQTVADTAPAPAAVRASLPLVFFHKPGCEECRRTRELLASLKNSFPTLTVTEYNIMEASSTLLNQALCARFGVPSAQHTVTPALFTQAGFAVRDDITPDATGALLERTMALTQDDSWQELSRGETAAAAAEVDRRYESLTLSVVVLAGLLDGINPCAFATIIFFLSWLQIARRTPREMLLTGAAFILAVFLAYLAAGLVLYQVLAGLSRFTWIQRWMNVVFALFALFAAFLSFRDAWRASRGRMGDMSLQLPAFLKNRIRSTIRSGAKARRFIIAAFVTGLIVSLLELACTGQVYAPIVYQIQQGRSGAIAWLVLYNVAFILPLIAIFLLTWAGLRSEHLIAFQTRHTRLVKFALGLLFLGLAALIWFSDRLLH